MDLAKLENIDQVNDDPSSNKPEEYKVEVLKEDSQERIDLTFKVIVLGDSGVGKTNIIKRILNRLCNHRLLRSLRYHFTHNGGILRTPHSSIAHRNRHRAAHSKAFALLNLASLPKFRFARVCDYQLTFLTFYHRLIFN